MQNDVNNMFLQQAQSTIDLNPEDLTLVRFGNLFPLLIPFVMCILIVQMMLIYLFRKVAPVWLLPQIKESGPFWILRRVSQIINTKTSNEQGTHSVDLLQLMLDASTKDAIHVSNSIYFL
jgi:hypothetical protein